jgi:protein TonB
MQNLNFLETELLDILFRGKNKEYGAYMLRKNYPSRVKQAMGITVLFLMLLSAAHWLIPKGEPLTITPIICELPFIKPLDDIEMVQTGAPPAPIYEQILTESIPTEIVKTVDVPPTEIIEEKTLVHQTTAEGLEPTAMNPSLSGTGGTGDAPPGLGKSSGAGQSSLPVVTPTPKEKIDFTPREYAEVMPVFPGGESAMLEYLRSRIQYPKMAIDFDVQGTVFVQFVVNTTGKISQVKVLKGLGQGCDREAVRVIKSMPAWSPGTQDGHKVNVSFVLPVQFEL